MVTIDCITNYAGQQAAQGATAAVLMGGTASKYLTKHQLRTIINRLSRVLPIGLYSGEEVDEFFMSNKDLRWYKVGAYVDTLGGLTSTKTNQRFYQRNKNGEWEKRNDLFQTSK